MSKCLFLVAADYYLYDVIADENTIVRQQFKVLKNKFMRGIRRAHYLSKIPGFEFWFNNLKNIDFSTVDIIVIISRNYADVLYKRLKKKTDKKIVFWYANPIEKEGIFLPDLGIPKEIVYSFDKTDCSKYGLKYNSQFYTRKLRVSHMDIKYDVLFVGKDKGRLQQLKSIENYFREMGLRTLFYIVGDTKKASNKTYRSYISYEEILKLIAQSRIILDFNQEGQSGLTLRPLEAVFFEKKLITNNMSIKSECIYDPRNIKIVDYNNFFVEYDWLNSSYVGSNYNNKEYYDFENWVNRFLEG